MKYTIEVLEDMFLDGALSEKWKDIFIHKLLRNGQETLREERDRWHSQNPPEPLKKMPQIHDDLPKPSIPMGSQTLSKKEVKNE